MNKLDENWAIEMEIDSMVDNLEGEGFNIDELVIAVKYKDRTIAYNGHLDKVVKKE